MRLPYKKLKTFYPEAVALLENELFKTNNRTKLFNFFDDNRVRVYTGYGGSGGFKVEVYRSKTNEEFKRDNPNKELDLNWRMTRIGWIPSYSSREIAEQVGFTLAFRELNFLLTNKESDSNIDELLKDLR